MLSRQVERKEGADEACEKYFLKFISVRPPPLLQNVTLPFLHDLDTGVFCNT